MRKFVGAAVLVLAMAVGTRVAVAQIVDPTTGITVDASTDPMDFSAIMSGQATNVGLEVGLSAATQMNADMNANMAASQAATQSMMDSMNASSASDDAATPVAPARPMTPKPVIAPGGWDVQGKRAGDDCG